jgi:GntR family transcriptional regulator/MocR family aminotransferase
MPHSLSPTSLLISLDERSAEPLHRQIYHGVRSAILDGFLSPETRLPSSRALAADLGVARSTVLVALDQLIAEGYLVTRPGSGTRVPRVLPESLLSVRGPREGAARRPRPTRREISRRGAHLAATPHGAARLGAAPRPFRSGTPAIDLFPVDLWARITARRARRLSMSQLDAGNTFGYRPLREAIATHIHASRGVRCEPDQVLIVFGAQHALDFATRMLLDPGDAAWLEEPGYLGVRSAFISAGARIVPVPVDDDGLDVVAGAERAADARAVYVSPSHQYPLGVTMTLARRLALLEWARRSGAWVLEDDYDSEYRYSGHPLMALQGLDEDERVVYIGTFSKTMFPTLRLGFVVVPPDLVESFVAARGTGDLPPTLEQAVMADFITEGHFARHLRRMRVEYEARQNALVEAVKQELAGALHVEPRGTGMHLVGLLPRDVPDQAVSREAAALGVEVSPLSMFYARRARRNGLVLGYGAVDASAIKAGMMQLARAVEQACRHTAA